MSANTRTVLAGMFFVGCFVGGVVTNNITVGSAGSDFTEFIPAVLGGAFGVAVLGFGGEHMKSPQGILGYGLGLVVSMLWQFSHNAFVNLQSTVSILRFIGGAHILALIVMTGVICVWLILHHRNIVGDEGPGGQSGA